MTRGKISTLIPVALTKVDVNNYHFGMPVGADADDYYLGEHQLRGIATPDADFAISNFAGDDDFPAGWYLSISLGAAGGEIIESRPGYMTVEIPGMVGTPDAASAGDNVVPLAGFTGTQRYGLVASPAAAPGVATTSYVALIQGIDASGNTIGEYLETLEAADVVNFNFQVYSIAGGA